MKVEWPKQVMRGFMALLLIAAFMVGLMWVVTQEVPEANIQLVTYMLGQLSILASIPVTFYFGSNKEVADRQIDRVARTSNDEVFPLTPEMETPNDP